MKEKLSQKPIAPTTETFAGLVSYETMCGGGFNFWETSFLFPKDESIISVYIGDKILSPNVNIIVGSKVIKKEKGFRYEWYFGTFEGKSRGETEGEETEEFDRKMTGILTPEHIIDGRSLERRIKAVINRK